jgi:hypothetical protein
MILKWQVLTASEVRQPNFSFAISSHRTVATITLHGKANGKKLTEKKRLSRFLQLNS